jgi:hypothetical protein
MRESVWPFPWVGSCLETLTGETFDGSPDFRARRAAKLTDKDPVHQL